MEEPESLIDDIEISAQTGASGMKQGTWGRKLCGINWRIDVPVPSGDQDADSTTEPHAIVEALFSHFSANGDELYDKVHFRLSQAKLDEIVSSFSKASAFAKTHV
ncbi:hypothetical protein BLNAU_16034 [Blattamonas nauphoetae]|uniref:COMM domain-containing protein n=1 Tax=Blattamonas nauphoetae TaxID=2049346 RepID=A0ABQ9XCB3_9EUKA|nr:hypothetical protein BLNAU_16034 [Blattamonas nauphoetae]